MEKYTVIRCGRLYDGLTDEIKTNQEILINGNLILETGPHVSRPAGCEEIDLSHLTVTPGLIDAHVHFSFIDWRKRRHETIYEAPHFKGMSVLYNARKALRRGFTTCRHVGANCDDAFGSVTAKRLINEGLFEGCRLVVAPHYVSTTRSHGDSSQQIASNPMVSDFIWSHYPGNGCGADGLREVVRRQVKYGADLIKIFATGGFSTPGDTPEDITFSDDELRAVIETAHSLHKKVTSHSYTSELIKKEIEFGIDGIEHGSLNCDPEVIQLMIDKKVDYVPTMSAFDEIVHLDEKRLEDKPYEFKMKLIRYADMLITNRKMVVESALEFGFGTDFTSVHHPYASGIEYKTMLTSGVDPFRALRAATKVNAGILEMKGKIGAIAPGCYADIAGWSRDLLTDPEALMDCAFVMKDGVSYPTECALED